MIEVRDLSFGYRRNEPILEHIDHRFRSGLVWALTGPSGCGKSTLLYLVGALLTPWHGAILHGGSDIASRSDVTRSRFRAETIGFVFQDAALDPARTVIDNIVETSVYARMERADAMSRARELMDRFGVALRADHRPGEVSGGQAQRIALCRALVNRPSVILADEPTGNLDATTTQVVVDALVELAHSQGKTVIIATHDPSVMAGCDRKLEL